MANKVSAWWSAHKPTTRRLIQIYAALLYNANLKGFIEGNIFTGATKSICVPGLNCYSCPGAIGACPLGALQNALAASNYRAPFFILGILMLFALTLGRTICGWLCPFGLIEELLHKLPTPKLKKSRFTHALSYLKYVILAVFVIAIPLIYTAQYLPVPGFCKYICPAGTLEGAVALLANPVNADKFSMLNILFTEKFIIMVLILVSCIFIYRAFCRFLCPLGAIYGMFSRLAVIGVKVDKEKCTNCGRCVTHCGMDIRRVGDHECINCGKCIDVCHEKAITLKCGKLTLMKNDGERKDAEIKRKKARTTAIWCAALALLAAILLIINLAPQDKGAAGATGTDLPAAGEALPGQDDIPIGYEVGMRCPDFTAPLYNGSGEFELTRGKPVIINFWATWCSPCIAELPYFEKIHNEYGDKLAVIALHSSIVTDDVQIFLDSQDLSFLIGLDESGEIISSLGGSTMLPMTVILDKDGVIVYNKTGSVTYEQLQSLLEPLVQA